MCVQLHTCMRIVSDKGCEVCMTIYIAARRFAFAFFFHHGVSLAEYQNNQNPKITVAS